jgi:hypothetical protein
MSAWQWIAIIGLLLLLWFGVMVIRELRRIRGTFVELVGSIAQALWRIRDELSETNQHRDD